MQFDDSGANINGVDVLVSCYRIGQLAWTIFDVYFFLPIQQFYNVAI